MHKTGRDQMPDQIYKPGREIEEISIMRYQSKGHFSNFNLIETSANRKYL